MGLFRSEEEVLKDEKKQQDKDLKNKIKKEKEENERKRFYEELGIDSKEDMERLENIKEHSKKDSRRFYKSPHVSGDYMTYCAICASMVIEFNILNILLDNKKALNSLVGHNKDLNDKLDTLIKQNEDLNNKFDTLIDILKSK